MLKEIPKPKTHIERNDTPPYTAMNGYTFESFTADDGTVFEKATRGSVEKWFILEEEN